MPYNKPPYARVLPLSSIELNHLSPPSHIYAHACCANYRTTNKALESSGVGSDIALELVRRSLTQLPTLAKVLYTATAEELAADAGLRSLHQELGSGLELYGALVEKGIIPPRRDAAEYVPHPWIMTMYRDSDESSPI